MQKKALFAAIAVAVSTVAPMTGDAVADGLPFDRARITPKALSRFPQPVRVSDLVAIPAVGWELARLGTTEKVVRASDGGVSVVIDYGGPLVFLGSTWRSRQIALPVETLGMLGRNVMIMDIPPSDLDHWPSWDGVGADLKSDDIVRVPLTKS